MTFAAALIIIASAFMHAGWNFLGKKNRPYAAFFLIADLGGIALLLPILIVAWPEVVRIPHSVWVMLIFTGAFQALYYTGLGGAYRHGQLSIAYPLARALPVISTGVIGGLLPEAQRLSPGAIAGMALIVGGTFLLPMRHFSDFSLANYLNRSCAWALAAAIGTTGYSLLDSAALKVVRDCPELDLGDVTVTLTYALMEALSIMVWLLVGIGGRRLLTRGATRSQRAQVRIGPALLAGFGIYATYSLVLIAMGLVSHVGYVVAFRQLSIPIGAGLGIVVLKEAAPTPKKVGLAVMLVGLVLVAVA